MPIYGTHYKFAYPTRVPGTRIEAPISTSPEAMTNHLVKRGNQYYIRRRIPTDLLDHFKQREWALSLHTKNLKDAERLCRIASLEMDEKFNAARAKITGGFEPRAEIPKSTDVHRLEADASLFEVDQRRAELREIVRAVLEESGLLLPSIRFGLPALPVLPETYRRRSNPKGTERVRTVRFDSTRSLDVLVRAWATERGVSLSSKESAWRTVMKFHTLVGVLSVPTITKADIVEFKNKLLMQGSSPQNSNYYIGVLSVLLNYAIGQDWISSNVTRGVKIVVKDRQNLDRIAFTEKSLNAIFSSDIYTAGERPSGGAGEAAYWLPLLGLYTGARIEEICQLAPSNVREERYRNADGVEVKQWVIVFTNEGEGQTLKNKGSRRWVPIHAELLSRGFVKYVASRKKETMIFNLRPGRNGRKANNWSAWFHKNLRSSWKVTDTRQVFHSFRHTFKDVCRECGIEKDLRDALQGHTEKGAAGGYGGEFYPLRPLAEAMKRFHVSGVKLPPISAGPSEKSRDTGTTTPNFQVDNG